MIDFLLNWAMLAVSLFNTIILFWLGLTVLLNAEKRAAGVWLASAGLLAGGIFFVAHTAMLDYSLDALLRGLPSWWYLGWASVITLPLGWYALMLWYAGFWDDRTSTLHRRQKPWLALVLLLALGMSGIVLWANPFRLLAQVAHLDLAPRRVVGGLPALMVIFPLYLVGCISLSLDALRRPSPSARIMGDLARRRARPWLMASSMVQLFVSLLIAGTMAWMMLSALRGDFPGTLIDAGPLLNGFEFLVSALIGVAIVLAGKAIVSYEIFTGKTLPRSGFLRQWRWIVLLAAGYGTLVSLSLGFDIRPIYPLLLTTVLMSVFFGLFCWRSYAERESNMAALRPFVSSQHLYEHLLTPDQIAPGQSGGRANAAASFRALCAEVLEARAAFLVPLGPFAALVGPALTYPDEAVLPALGDLPAQLWPQTMCVPLDPARWGEASWAVPLWSARGLIGVLLLGDKQGGGLYTQEEIEIAQASGERLIDTQASAAMAGRLMNLQRQRMAQSQVLDRRTRRTLHDDVLPRLHTAMLSLSAASGPNGAAAEALNQLAAAHRQISDLLRDMPAANVPEVARLGVLGALRQSAGEELSDAFDEVTWHIEAEAEQLAQSLPALPAEVLFYAAREAMRNAARHGRDGERPLHLNVSAHFRDGLEIAIEDDGIGLGQVGRATVKSGGSGQGLALHGTLMAVIGGELSTESLSDAGTRVRLRLPLHAAGAASPAIFPAKNQPAK